MSPILVRPVREQLEHDRVIRLLQAKYKRKFEVAINPGHEQTVPVVIGTSPWYPDLVLQSTDRGRKLLGTVEVETAESVNNLEAMSQWVAFSKLRAPFHLYVPASNIDTAKRLCTDLQVAAAEIWSYSALGDQMRFTLVQRSSRSAAEPKARTAAPRAAAPRTAAPRTAAPRTAAPRTAAPRSRSSAAAGRKAAAKKSPARSAGARKKPAGSSRTQKRR